MKTNNIVFTIFYYVLGCNVTQISQNVEDDVDSLNQAALFVINLFRNEPANGNL